MSEPILIGLLFADRIITEKNGKKGIIGIFSQFASPKFPVIFPPWAIYAAVTNLTGKHKFAINLIHEEASQNILPINGEFDSKDRNAVIEFTPQINGVVFPDQGKYNLSFHIDGTVIGSRILNVNLIEKSGG